MMQQIKVRLTGVGAMLMHNGQLADPQNKWTKELKAVTSRRKKTDEDMAEARRIEWMGGLIVDEEGRPAITGSMVLGTWRDGGKKLKLGKDIVSALSLEEFYQLEYDGPKDLRALYEDARFVDSRTVRVGQVRVVRTRPAFRGWRATITAAVDTDVIDVAPALQALEIAGTRIGIGDFRPQYGRFTVEQV